MTIMRRRKTAAARDAQGRKRCSRGDKCLHPGGPWLPESAFGENNSVPDGLRWECKRCVNARNYDRRKKNREDPRPRSCRICGEPTQPNSSYCDEHHTLRIRQRKRNLGGYVCVDCGDKAWLGGWFSQAEMNEMLKAGSWEAGMVFRYKKNKGTITQHFLVMSSNGAQILLEIQAESAWEKVK